MFDKNAENVWEEDYEDPARLEQWTRVGGGLQSTLFTIETLRKLEWAGLKPHKFGDFDIHDYGCANGFGTMVLASEFPFAQVKGIDISKQYIEHAKKLFPSLTFEQGDINKPKEVADIIWTTHTVEHLKKPVECVENLCQHARQFVVVVTPPIAPNNRDETHRGSPDTIEYLKGLNDCVGELLLLQTDYITWRKNAENGLVIKEGNILLAFRGLAE